MLEDELELFRYPTMAVSSGYVALGQLSRCEGLSDCRNSPALASGLRRSSRDPNVEPRDAVGYPSGYTGRGANGAKPWSLGCGIVVLEGR